MKGYRHQTNYDTKKNLIDNLILKSLPYGKWTTKDNEEFLFNRDYEPIIGWDLTLNKPIPVSPGMWIGGNGRKEEFYYSGENYPYRDENTLRKCWDILADWTAREND